MTRLVPLLALLALLVACSDDTTESCFDDPTIPECVASCRTDPTQSFCTPDDMGTVEDMPNAPDLGPCGDCGDQLCDTESGDCVDCLTEAECDGATPLCGPGGTCVACVEDSDCTDPTAPECNAGTCGDCTSDDACAGRADTPACDEPSGDCVECTVDTEETNCPAPDNLACHPTDLTCTGAERGTVGVCQQCISDSECVENHRCVPTTFTDDSAMTHEAAYCLLDFATSGDAVCPNRWPAKRLATSVGGVEAEYCFVDDELSTCDAVRDYRSTCPGGDDECGVEGIGDGLCRDGLCTYACLGGRDCASGDVADCIGADPTYCDPN